MSRDSSVAFDGDSTCCKSVARNLCTLRMPKFGASLRDVRRDGCVFAACAVMGRGYGGIMELCCPRSDSLCDRCIADALAQMSGVAACRGEFWAMKVSERCAIRRPWPPYEGRCRELALRRVFDLASDERLREQLAMLVVKWASRWWERAGRAFPQLEIERSRSSRI